MNQTLLFGESIRTIEIFYYSSHNHIFINTTLIQLLNQRRLPQNIKIIKTQINEPKHHVHGQAPFITVNSSKIIKKAQIWDFLVLILGIDLHRKYEFLSIACLAQQLSKIINIFSEYDRNPYYMFISPWRKYKKHQQLQQQKHWFRQNTQYFNLHDNTLNKQYFLYKLNSLGSLIQNLAKPGHTKSQFLLVYKIMVYSLMKHMKRVEQKLYKVATQVKIFVQIQDEIQKNIINLLQNQQGRQKIPARNIIFTNVNLKYVNEKQQLNKQQQQKVQYDSQRQKFYQKIFRPLFVTMFFGLAMYAFKKQQTTQLPTISSQ